MICQRYFITSDLDSFSTRTIVHVSNGDGEARYMVDPIILIDNQGLKPRDLRIAEVAIEENREIIIDRWNECFTKKK
ncbi:DUF4160 domain-containing protein [Massilibacteroides sp.]|uniref:DUF4160 domain-containing protein n=1 Tax=Massilibacteroides sp. TaxID=2034766 RepID=UPI0026374774|nr:DUF4160 domain-containing protein [Massilibacteroides sp.]MDD4516282.1 DUF4160 domain-containing protein [Massilibacteroides sp.]